MPWTQCPEYHGSQCSRYHPAYRVLDTTLQPAYKVSPYVQFPPHHTVASIQNITLSTQGLRYHHTLEQAPCLGRVGQHRAPWSSLWVFGLVWFCLGLICLCLCSCCSFVGPVSSFEVTLVQNSLPKLSQTGESGKHFFSVGMYENVIIISFYLIDICLVCKVENGNHFCSQLQRNLPWSSSLPWGIKILVQDWRNGRWDCLLKQAWGPKIGSPAPT